MVQPINVVKISSIISGDVLIQDVRWKKFVLDNNLVNLIQYHVLAYNFEIADYQAFFQEAARLNNTIDNLYFVIE